MAVTLSWSNRVVADEIRIYRDTSPFTAASLPGVLATIDAEATAFVDDTAPAGTTLYYAVAAVRTTVSPETVALSDVEALTTSAVSHASGRCAGGLPGGRGGARPPARARVRPGLGVVGAGQPNPAVRQGKPLGRLGR